MEEARSRKCKRERARKGNYCLRSYDSSKYLPDFTKGMPSLFPTHWFYVILFFVCQNLKK